MQYEANANSAGTRHCMSISFLSKKRGRKMNIFFSHCSGLESFMMFSMLIAYIS